MTLTACNPPRFPPSPYALLHCSGQVQGALIVGLSDNFTYHILGFANCIRPWFKNSHERFQKGIDHHAPGFWAVIFFKISHQLVFDHQDIHVGMGVEAIIHICSLWMGALFQSSRYCFGTTIITVVLKYNDNPHEIFWCHQFWKTRNFLFWNALKTAQTVHDTLFFLPCATHQ